MRKYIIRRIFIALFALLAIIFILFALMQFLPGSPFNDEKLTPEQSAVLAAKYGLDQPFTVQFFRYLKNMLTGDFGVSYTISKNTPIVMLLQSRLPISLIIGGISVIVGTLLGLLLGIVGALKHNTFWDTITTVVSVLGISIPSYVFALLISYQLGFKLNWFPMLYNQNAARMSMILPVMALSMTPMATVARFTRTELLSVLGSDYMLLAESKGVSGIRLLFVHALRNASIPILTVLAPLVVGLMTGSLVIEKIFSVPGIGQLLVQAIQSNDYNVIVCLSFIYSALFIGIILVVDILYGILDPRIRLAKE